MFISDQEMFLRDTLDPASKMHRLPIDAVRDAGVFSGAVGITPALIFGYLVCLFFRGSPKKETVNRLSSSCPMRQFTGTTRISDGAFARYSLNPNMI